MLEEVVLTFMIVLRNRSVRVDEKESSYHHI